MDTEERANSRKLEAVMTKHGFIPYPYEWWHFDYKNWQKYPPLDMSLGELVRETNPVVRCTE